MQYITMSPNQKPVPAKSPHHLGKMRPNDNAAESPSHHRRMKKTPKKPINEEQNPSRFFSSNTPGFTQTFIRTVIADMASELLWNKVLIA